MIRMSWIKLLSVGAIALAGTAKLAQADVVIGNFEDSTLDQFGSAGGPATPTLAQSTVAGTVTLGTHSLASSEPAGSFWGASDGNAFNNNGFGGNSTLANWAAATRFSYDETMIAADMFTGDNPSSGNFAQSNELAIEISWNSGGTLTAGGNSFIQKNVVTGNATDSLMATQTAAGQWDGVDGTRTVSWDLSKFKLTDPSTATSVSFGAFILAHTAQISSLTFSWTQQTGDDSANGDGPAGTMFFDNVKLIIPSVPEPASLGGLALLSMLGLRRRKA
jgi:hypothetical protein